MAFHRISGCVCVCVYVYMSAHACFCHYLTFHHLYYFAHIPTWKCTDNKSGSQPCTIHIHEHCCLFPVFHMGYLCENRNSEIDKTTLPGVASFKLCGLEVYFVLSPYTQLLILFPYISQSRSTHRIRIIIVVQWPRFDPCVFGTCVMNILWTSSSSHNWKEKLKHGSLHFTSHPMPSSNFKYGFTPIKMQSLLIGIYLFYIL